MSPRPFITHPRLVSDGTPRHPSISSNLFWSNEFQETSSTSQENKTSVYPVFFHPANKPNQNPSDLIFSACLFRFWLGSFYHGTNDQGWRRHIFSLPPRTATPFSTLKTAASSSKRALGSDTNCWKSVPSSPRTHTRNRLSKQLLNIEMGFQGFCILKKKLSVLQ